MILLGSISSLSVLPLLRRPAPTDAYRTLLDPMWSRDARGRIESVRPLTATASVVRIRTNRAWRGHRAGQFVTLGLEIDGVRHQRCYSITSVPNGPGTTIEIAVQRVDGGLVSSHLVERAWPGDLVHLGAPGGDFTLPDLTPDRLLFVAGGSGITPLVGMLRTLAGRAPVADVVVLHHAPTIEQAMFAPELHQLAARHDWLRVQVVETQRGGTRLDDGRLATMCPDWADRDAYVCGPAPMIDFATRHWAEHNVIERLHLERFTLDLAAASRPEGAPASASFSRSGVTTSTDGGTLLDAAESAGVAAPFGCRTGVCHTCSTRLVSGCTTDLRDGRTSEAGAHVQLCVSAALTDVVLDV